MGSLKKSSRKDINPPLPNKTGRQKKLKLLRVPFTQEEYELYCKLTLDRIFAHFFANVKFAISVLKEVLDQETLDELDLNGLTIAPTERLDESLNKFYLDMLYEIPLRDGTGFQNFYTVLEHKSYPDHWTLFQTFEYSCRVLSNSRKTSSGELPAVAAIIVHQGSQPYAGPTNMSEYFPQSEGLRKFAIDYKGLILDTSSKSGRTFKYDPNVPHKDLVLKMMRAISAEDKLPAARQFLEELNERELDEDLIRLRRMFIVSLDKIAKIDITAIKELEKTTQPPKVEEMSTLDELMKQSLATGLARGREEGLATGREEGRRQTQIQSIISILRARFGRIPASISRRVKEMTDIVALQSLTVGAATCATIKEFQENL